MVPPPRRWCGAEFELAGACWVLPELADLQAEVSIVNTLKDTLLWELAHAACMAQEGVLQQQGRGSVRSSSSGGGAGGGSSTSGERTVFGELLPVVAEVFGHILPRCTLATARSRFCRTTRARTIRTRRKRTGTESNGNGDGTSVGGDTWQQACSLLQKFGMKKLIWKHVLARREVGVAGGGLSLDIDKNTREVFEMLFSVLNTNEEHERGEIEEEEEGEEDEEGEFMETEEDDFEGRKEETLDTNDGALELLHYQHPLMGLAHGMRKLYFHAP